jgi:hypothetical protein
LKELPEFGMDIDAVRQKIKRLGLEVVVAERSLPTTTSCEMPKELFTVEQVLLSLARAVKTLEQPSLDKDETLRLLLHTRHSVFQALVYRLSFLVFFKKKLCLPLML